MICIVFISCIYFIVCLLLPSWGSGFNYHGVIALPDFSNFFQLDLKHSFTLALFPAIFAPVIMTNS